MSDAMEIEKPSETNGNTEKPAQTPDSATTKPAVTGDDDDDDVPIVERLKKVQTSSTPKKSVVDDSDDDDVPLSQIQRKKKANVITDDDDAKGAASPKVAKKTDDAKKVDGANNGKVDDVKKAATVPVKKEPGTSSAATTPSKPTATVKKEASTPVKKENGTSNNNNNNKRKREEPPKKTPPKKSKKDEESDSDSDSDSDSSSSDSDSDSDSGSSSSSSDSDSGSSSSESDSSSDDSDDDDRPLVEKLKKKKEQQKSTPKKSASSSTTPAKKKVASTTTTPKEKAKKKASTPIKKETTPKKKVKKEENGGDTEGKVKRRVKKEEEAAQPQYKWWLEDPLPEGKKWKTLEHNGVFFPPEYKPHGVKLVYDGQPIDLTPEQEEVATFYAQYLATDHVKSPVFSKNFFKEFLKVLNPDKKKGAKPHPIQVFDKCDFTAIHRYLMEQKEKKKSMSAEEKEKEKAEKKQLEDKYGWAMVDGYRQKIANWRVEPPGLFLGRGEHPKKGMMKRRVQPEDVTINIGKKAPVPECPVPGRKWGKIVNNDEAAWLAFWKDNINDSFKYVWLSASSRIKGEADMRKFRVAQNLKNHIDDIRAKYVKELKNKDLRIRQRATAMYFIDHLALRAGNEKDEDEADTVGCCSLRVEHIKLREPNIVDFDFLGKDSMRYQNSVAVDDQVFKNLQTFMHGKSPKDDLFELLTTTGLNSHLKSEMEGLTAKVFRTFNASITLQNELAKQEDLSEMSVAEKMLEYNRANREVAILCNHQKSVSKNFSEQMGKLDDKINEMKQEKKLLKQHLEELKSGKKRKKTEDDDDDDAKKKKQKLPDDPAKVKKKLETLNTRIAAWETKKTEKDELKTVSLTTSKINYIDPRISVAWAKKHGVPIEKIFSKTLREKFPWAMDVDADWKF